MEEELQKRNTDCVYFLASPLTCKKGIDCEYRHSEIARLNPRDCWYWLAGNCLNPTCGFRHPPLDTHTEAPSESASLPYQSTGAVSKTSISCYFYFNSFCSKGDRCPFLHGSDGGALSAKSLTTASAITNALPSENKTYTNNDTGSKPNETYHTQSETAPKPAMRTRIYSKGDLREPATRIYSTGDLPPPTARSHSKGNLSQPAARIHSEGHHHPAMRSPSKGDLQQPASKLILQQSASLQLSASESEGAVMTELDSFLPTEDFARSRTDMCRGQDSEEWVDGQIEPEDRWESSPGFDVLVDNKPEEGYEDDPEYFLALDRERSELNGPYLGYDFEDPKEYEPMYPNAEFPYERDLYDVYNQLDAEHFFDSARTAGRSSERMLDTLLSRKRKHLPIKLTVNDLNDIDLRDHLRKRRAFHDYPATRLSRRPELSHLIDRSQERPRRYGMDRRLRGRLASEVGMNSIGLLEDKRALSNGDDQCGRLRHSHSGRSRQRYKEKRLVKQHTLPSEISRKPVSKEIRSIQESSTFSGPKTLAQIKEEKKKVENGDCIGKSGHSSRTKSADFQGPKPLSEILKDKRGLGSGDNISH